MCCLLTTRWLHCIDTRVFFALRAEGDILTVVTRDEPDAPDGWVKCLFRGHEGVVPENYVKKHNI